MEFFSHPLIAVVMLLGVLVIVHETGHFLVGKLFKIPVEIYSIGFGPTIFGFKGRETHYRISAIPLGGYVKFYGSLPSEPVPEALKGREYFRAPIYARFATIAAGPLANFLLAVIVFAGMVMYGIQQPPALIGEIVPGSPADRAGIKFGDKIQAIDTHEVRSWKDVQRLIGDRPQQNLQLDLLREGQALSLSLAPEAVKDEDLPGKRGRIGISRFMAPSVLTTVKDSGFLSEAGIKTGDRLLSAAWNGQVIEIKFWRQYLNFMEKVSQSPIKNFELTVVPFEPSADPSKPSPSPTPSRTVSINVPTDWTFQPSTLADATGVASAQLTVYKAEAPLQGVEKGDMILKFEGQKVSDAFDLSQLLTTYNKPNAKLTVLRSQRELEVAVELKAVEVQKAEGKATVYTLPIQFWGELEQPDWIVERYSNPFKALAFGFDETLDLTGSIGKAIGGLFTGEMPLATLGGPIAIAKVASESVRIGWQAFCHALALISINLALINLVPIPVLDGGQLLLLGAEAAARRPVAEATIENFQKVGFIMVLALFVIATYNDLGRFWASMLRGVSSMF